MNLQTASANARDLCRKSRRLAARLVQEDGGQDIIEYALLTGTIGIVAVVVWQNITGGVGAAYQGWDTGVQDLWEPPDPVVGP